MRHVQLLLACVFAALCLSVSPVAAILTTVGPGEVFTASEVVPPGYIVMFAFQLNPDFLLEVAAKDRDSGAVLHEWKDRPSGALNIPPSENKRVLHFSFNNVDSMFTSAYINFDIRLVESSHDRRDLEKLDPIENKVRGLFVKVQKVKGLLQTLRYQQRDHRATVEDANERVLLWSVLQVVGFVVVSGAQLYLLKLFLEKKRTV